MKKISILFLCIITTLLFSCNNRSKEDIENDLSSGVALIQNASYYELILEDGQRLYFSSFDKDEGIKGLAFSLDSVKVSYSYGTGFLISDDGKLVTNSHVVSNTASDEDVNKSMANIIRMVKAAIEMEYEERSSQLHKVNRLWQMAYFDNRIGATQYMELTQLRQVLIEAKNELAQTYTALDMINTRRTLIRYHNQVGVAFDNTYVTNNNDYKPCVIKKKDVQHDLAVIQLKDKRSPEGRHIFTLNNDDPLENYSMRDKFTKSIDEDKNGTLYMIGFNLGPSLALTKDGIKHQFNMGTISQKTDERIMYSIPTLPGSSGSPVVNQKGELVAINYAGLTGTQSFNYGIRVKYLNDLINREN